MPGEPSWGSLLPPSQDVVTADMVRRGAGLGSLGCWWDTSCTPQACSVTAAVVSEVPTAPSGGQSPRREAGAGMSRGSEVPGFIRIAGPSHTLLPAGEPGELQVSFLIQLTV